MWHCWGVQALWGEHGASSDYGKTHRRPLPETKTRSLRPHITSYALGCVAPSRPAQPQPRRRSDGARGDASGMAATSPRSHVAHLAMAKQPSRRSVTVDGGICTVGVRNSQRDDLPQARAAASLPTALIVARVAFAGSNDSTKSSRHWC